MGIDQYPSNPLTTPGTSTDNAVVRFDGTTGRAIQSAAVTIDDSGVMAGATISQSQVSSLVTDLNAKPGRNLLLNPAFNVNQRVFTSVTADSAYSFDRWRQGVAGGTVTTTPQTFTPGNAISGQEPKQYAQIVTASHANAGDLGTYVQYLEGVRTLAGQAATISFWAKAASGTPKIGVEVKQSFGSGGSPSAEVNTHIGAVTLSTSWARYEVTATIPSISGKTLGTGGDDILGIVLWLSGGSTFNARTGSIGNQNGTFSLWGVKLEAGSVATAFEQDDFSTDLRKCQRYYYRHATGSGSTIGVGIALVTSEFDTVVHFPVTMRIKPAIDCPNSTGYFATGSGTWATFYMDSKATNTAGHIYSSAPNYSPTQYSSNILYTNNASSYLGFTADL